jgi:O-antigen ligase
MAKAPRSTVPPIDRSGTRPPGHRSGENAKARSSRLSRSQSGEVDSTSPDVAEWLTLGVIVLAPLFAGKFDAVPAHGFSGIIALAALLTLARARTLAFPAAVRAMPIGAALLGLAATLSLIPSVAKGPSLVALTQWLSWLALFGLVFHLGRSAEGRRRVVGAVAIAALLVVGSSFLEYARAVREMHAWFWRTFGPFAGPNVLASFLAMTAPVLLAGCLGWERRGPALALGALVVLELATLPLTGSRGGLLAMGVGLGTSGLLALARRERPHRRAWRRLAGVIALGLPALFLCSFLGPVASRLAPARPGAAAGAGDAQAQSNQFRRLTWQSTARIALAHPLLGTGIGTFKYVHPRYAIAGFTEMAHQSYLQLAAETGVFGLFGLLTLLVGALVAALRAPPGTGSDAWLAAGLGGGIAASAVHNLVDYSWYVFGTAALFWTLLGLLAAARASTAPRAAAAAPAWLRPAALAAVTLLLAGNLLLESAAARSAAGEAARDDGKLDDAIEAFQGAAALLPLDPASHLALGDLLLARREHDLAQHDLPTTQRDGDAALAEYRTAVRLAPTRSIHYYRLGRAFVRLGQPRAALQAFQQGLAWDPHSTELLAEMAAVQEELGDRSGALESDRRIVAIDESPAGTVTALQGMRDSRPALAHEQLGLAALAAGRSEEGWREFRRAAEILRQRRQEQEAAGTEQTLRALGKWDADAEKKLRAREASLWERVATLATRAGRPPAADEARKLAAEARAAMPGP